MSEPRDPAAAVAASPQGGCRCAGGVGRAPSVLSLLFSLLSVGACFLLSARTSKLQGRLVALEGELASRAWSPEDQLDAEPLLALLQPQVDKVLQEKLGEGLAKLRTAREVPSECRCPPGPPGRRGKPGRRGEPGPPVSTMDIALGLESTKLRHLFPFLYNFIRTALLVEVCLEHRLVPDAAFPSDCRQTVKENNAYFSA
ncbi:collagen alpha-1(XXIII) chain-like isoform X1 [Heteronotia binoei]|uniref:collagen alpha-1(XXIII) chain-like isoform X1 n=1 Tax=Heteronotia binoei TaxID=13085 RepID=UPI00292D07C3|nr:collagen alpha-1(XXIII) chain-like isoform X1 [Heteronotia binoei]